MFAHSNWIEPVNFPVPEVCVASSAMAKFRNIDFAVAVPSSQRAPDSVNAVATDTESIAATAPDAVALAVDCRMSASVDTRVAPVVAVTVPRLLTPVNAAMMVPVTPRVRLPVRTAPIGTISPCGNT